MVAWTLEPGQKIKRTKLHQQFGGGRQGGIAPSAQSPNVFVFSDPAAGEQHGYYDGWIGDGVFSYTGEGQRGDQVFRAGNAAILNHAGDGRSLRVFDGARGTVTYVDEFELDENEPFALADAHETKNGPLRQVIVFRLRPKGIAPPEPRSKLAPILEGPARVDVPLERQQTEKAFVSPRAEPYEMERREQGLVLSLEAHLLGCGHQVVRQRLLPTGEIRPLFTDLYDLTAGLLVEAKATVQRNAIRMAIGQLADYRRFIDGGGPNNVAVLVPTEPRSDLCQLLISQQIDWIYPAAFGFEDSTGGGLVNC